MKRIPMSSEGRRGAALRKRKLAKLAKSGVLVLCTLTAALGVFAFRSV